MKKLYDAANAALDVVDTEIAQGFPEPEWATQLREAIAEMNAPEPSENEADWQSFHQNVCGRDWPDANR